MEPQVASDDQAGAVSQTDQDQEDGVYVPDDQEESEGQDNEQPSQDSDEPDPDPEPQEPESPKQPDPNEQIGREVYALKQQIANLNKALHQERQKAKQKQEEPVLTDDQLKQLISEHKDDPETMLQINRYIAEQVAKKANKESVDAQQLTFVKSKVDAHVSQVFPELLNESHPARDYVDKIKGTFSLASHPFGDYLAASAWVADNIEVIKRNEYERGKTEALQGKAESNRQQGIRSGAPIPPKSPPKRTSTHIPNEYKEVGERLGMTPDQLRIYAKLRGKSKSAMMEA